MRRAAAAAIACIALLAGCRDTPEASQDRYATWAARHAPEIAAYADDLRKAGVADIVPMSELLRTGRRWRACGVEEFAVPERAHWPAMRDTLRLVRDLRHAGVIAAPRVASAWRTPEFNRCEGGSGRSKHLANNALDFDLHAAADTVPNLCAWWRRHGRARNVGLGFYDATRIHVDTSGFRTWGLDYTRRTSPCADTQRFGR